MCVRQSEYGVCRRGARPRAGNRVACRPKRPAKRNPCGTPGKAAGTSASLRAPKGRRLSGGALAGEGGGGLGAGGSRWYKGGVGRAASPPARACGRGSRFKKLLGRRMLLVKRHERQARLPTGGGGRRPGMSPAAEGDA